jgi:hypothetical protein
VVIAWSFRISKISDDFIDPAAAILAGVRLVQQRLEIAPIHGGETDELIRSFLELILTYMRETHPTLTHALERAQAVPLPSEILDELMAAEVKMGKDVELANTAVVALIADEANKAQILRRGIAAIEHVTDETRALTKRTERLLEEFESGRSDRS